MSNKASIFCSNTLLNSFYCILDKVIQTKTDLFTNNIILVPDRFTLNAEKLFFEYAKIESTFNVEIMSLTRLVKTQCNNFTENYEILNQNSAILIVTKILLDNSNKLGLIKNTLSPTLAKEFYETIMQFKSSGILPDEISTKSNNINLKLKLNDIKFVYSEYQNCIKNKYLDSADLLDIFSAVIKNSENLKNTNIFVGMFENFSFKQLKAITSLAKTSKSFTIGLSATTLQNNKHIYLNETLHQVIQTLNNHNINYEIKNISKKINENFEFFAKNLYSFNSTEKKLNKNVNLIEASNESEEVDFVARKIKQLVLTENINFSDINIACTNFNRYKQVISKIFDNYSLPYFIDEQLTLSDHFFGRFILNLLNIINFNLDKNYLFEYLKSPFIEKNELQLDQFINYSLEYGVNYQSFLKPFKDDEIENLRQFYLTDLESLFENLKLCSTISDYINLIENFIEKLNCEQILIDISKDGNYDISFKNQTSQVYEKLINCLNHLTISLGTNACTLEYFTELLKSLFANVNIKTVPLGVNKIFVGDAESSTFYPNKYLFIVGAVEGSLPKYKNDCGLVVDSEIELLTSKNVLCPSIRFTNKVAKYKLFELVLSTQSQLFISFSSLTFGEITRPSEIFEEIKKLLVDINNQPITNYKVSNEIFYLQLANKPKQDYLFALGSKSHLQEVLAKQEQNQPLYSAKYLLNNYQLRLSKQHSLEFNSKNLFFNNKKTSVSQIERYFACPYQHFASYGLKLKERKIYGIKSVDVGNFLHAVAEEFVKYLIKNNYKYDEKIINQIISKVLDNQQIDVSSVEKFKQESLNKEAQRLCKKIFEQISASNFKPKYVEKKFESLDYSNNLKVVGKVDRIDEYSEMLIIFDYKTGSKTDFSYKDIYYGNKIQLIVYLTILESMLNMTSSGAFYFPIKNKFIEEDKIDKLSGIFLDQPEIFTSLDLNLTNANSKSNYYKIDITKDGNLSANSQKNALSPLEFLSIKNYVKSLFNNAITEIFNGYIEPKPCENTCNSCPYQLMCNFNAKKDGTRIKKLDIDKQTFTGENSGEE